MRLRQFDKSDGIVNDMIHGIHEGTIAVSGLVPIKVSPNIIPGTTFSIIIISLTLASRNSLMTLIGMPTPSVYSFGGIKDSLG